MLEGSEEEINIAFLEAETLSMGRACEMNSEAVDQMNSSWYMCQCVNKRGGHSEHHNIGVEQESLVTL